jgi:hypothetical protein
MSPIFGQGENNRNNQIKNILGGGLDNPSTPSSDSVSNGVAGFKLNLPQTILNFANLKFTDILGSDDISYLPREATITNADRLLGGEDSSNLETSVLISSSDQQSLDLHSTPPSYERNRVDDQSPSDFEKIAHGSNQEEVFTISS